MFKEEVIGLIVKATGLEKDQIEPLIEIPKDSKLGDFAFPCFLLSKKEKKSPNIIAIELSSKINPSGAVEKIQTVGPYVNFFVNKNILGQKIIHEILSKREHFGKASPKHEKIMIEYPAPNTNKPLHLGHVRNMLLGKGMCNILSANGFEVIPVNLVNDRGIHICKSMLAYKKWGHEKFPDKKTDHFVGDYYVMYSQKEKEHPELEEEAQKMLKKWENNDLETAKLWSKMRKWALDGHDETYKVFDLNHKKTYYESEIYTLGKDIIRDGLKNNIFEKDQTGAIIINLEKEGLGKKVLIRSDGTSIYITQDIALAKIKYDEFGMDRSINVVGNEQEHHFKVLFKILEKLGMPFAKKCYHLSYGMISLPEGRMKSREGTVVDADDIINEMKKVASNEIKKRHQLSDEELEKRAKIISLGAIKFFFLKYAAEKDFTYSPEESISFEGETGPYVQYAHARICSILRQNPEHEKVNHQLGFSHESESELINLLSKYENVLQESALKYDPSLVARYCLTLAQGFSTFYSNCPVLKSEDNIKHSRLQLIKATKIVLQNSLSLLGIDSPEEM